MVFDIPIWECDGMSIPFPSISIPMPFPFVVKLRRYQ